VRVGNGNAEGGDGCEEGTGRLSAVMGAKTIVKVHGMNGGNPSTELASGAIWNLDIANETFEHTRI